MTHGIHLNLNVFYIDFSMFLDISVRYKTQCIHALSNYKGVLSKVPSLTFQILFIIVLIHPFVYGI